jgi:hypothetical protein
MEEWIEINSENGVWTFAANIPGGVLIRVEGCDSSGLTFVPDIMVTKEGKLNGIYYGK